jgi:hypothetical protein
LKEKAKSKKENIPTRTEVRLQMQKCALCGVVQDEVCIPDDAEFEKIDCMADALAANRIEAGVQPLRKTPGLTE